MRSVACRDCDEKVTVLVMGIILYAVLFSDVTGAFFSGGTGNISDRKEVRDWIGERRSRLLPHFMKN